MFRCLQVRNAWSDSASYLDTDEMYRRAFELDVAKALASHGLSEFILKHDDGESDGGGEDWDNDGIEDDEIDEVAAAMWEHHNTICNRAAPT